MKQYGFVGKGTGKLGSSVFAISGGEQIVRQYNPVVSNPQTEAQTEQRAKFKLMTQLAAAMSGQIAFRKSGLTSARNKFVSFNIKNTEFNNDSARTTLQAISLTGGSIEIGAISAQRGENNVISVALQAAAPANVTRVVYVAYASPNDTTLNLIEEKVVSVAGDNRTFPTSINAIDSDVIIYAYGVIETSTKAKVAFDSYNAVISDDEAFVEVLKSLTTSDYQLTATTADIVAV